MVGMVGPGVLVTVDGTAGVKVADGEGVDVIVAVWLGVPEGVDDAVAVVVSVLDDWTAGTVGRAVKVAVGLGVGLGVGLATVGETAAMVSGLGGVPQPARAFNSSKQQLARSRN
jgi:hypothetical protein